MEDLARLGDYSASAFGLWEVLTNHKRLADKAQERVEVVSWGSGEKPLNELNFFSSMARELVRVQSWKLWVKEVQLTAHLFGFPRVL